jgi:hypothetical protein
MNQLLRTALPAALAATLLLSGCGSDEPPAVVAPEAPPVAEAAPVAAAPAISVVLVELGKTVDPSGRVISPTSTFAPTDKVHAVVTTTNRDAGATVTGTLGARWTFQDGQVVHSDSKPFSLTGPGTTMFELSKESGWPPGNYKVEILLDTNLVATQTFTIAQQ